MKLLLSTICIFFCAAGLFAAPPLDGNSAIVSASASSKERDALFLEARSRVIKAAEKYEGTPYVFGGLSRKGIDCSGFVYLSFYDGLGITIPRTSGGQYDWVEKIPYSKAMPGDLIFFTTDFSGKITHVALYLGDGNFMHAASAGAKTGVIFSNLKEQYWANAFAEAGRAFPEPGSSTSPIYVATSKSGTDKTKTADKPKTNNPKNDKPKTKVDGENHLLAGTAVAFSFLGLRDGNVIAPRGGTSQLFLCADTYFFRREIVFGLEVRPEFDATLGVFRLPITFSVGPSDKFLVFVGYAPSFGEPSLSVAGGDRSYSASLPITCGFTMAPFTLRTKAGEFAPYAETAWQFYTRDSSSKDPKADFLSMLRLSAGIRWSYQIL